MKRIAWLTDIHLNFLTDTQANQFLASVAEVRPDAVLLGGDIAESHDVCDYLQRMHKTIAAPIYFVLGNHDFYHGSIDLVRRSVTDFCRECHGLHYLNSQDAAVELAAGVGLVGHDGWGDGRGGDYLRSTVVLNDYQLIAEFESLDKRARWEALKSRGDEAARHVRRVLPAALNRFRDVVLVTHVPPLPEACIYQGQIAGDQWLPHFTCLATGEAILEVMADHPKHRLTVLCGHTHTPAEAHPLPNVCILTGGAEYGHPAIQRIFEFDESAPG